MKIYPNLKNLIKMSDLDTKFYFRISTILLVVFSIWHFSSPRENNNLLDPEAETRPPKDTSATLTNFAPPILVVFNDNENTLPRRNWSAPALEINAEAALAMRDDGGRIYYNKNMEARRPIASLTKLMTAIVVLENYRLDEIIKIPIEAVRREGSRGDLRPSEEITVRALLNIMLIDSSNDAAVALAAQNPDFVSLMNKKAAGLGLKNTYFTNPDGVDEGNGYSTALDVAKIFSYLIGRHPEISEVLKTKNMVVYSADGKIAHRLENTNALLGEVGEIKAGKTGYTDKAGGALALLISGLSFGDKNNIITVVLGSSDRFGESEKIINWLRTAYIWER